MRVDWRVRPALLLITGIGIWSVVAAPQQTAPAQPAPAKTPDVNAPAPTFGDFLQRVDQYLKLQKSVPRLRTTKQAKEIADRKHGLAEKIRQSRPDAKQGDIFAPEIAEQFRAAIKKAFQGANAPNVRKTIRQGEPLPEWHLVVNANYPERMPTTTVPPTLLLGLPRLPSGLAYRIVGHDFILQDKEARLIVDFIPGAIP